jgi:hypothetical protein
LDAKLLQGTQSWRARFEASRPSNYLSAQGLVVEQLLGNGKAKVLCGLLLLLVSMIPVSARADIYKCTKAGAVSYQETPCEGANVQATHIEDRDSNHFVGCFVTRDNQFSHSIEVRANGAGTYQLIDERNPLGSGMVLKQATNEELLAVGNGLHIKVTQGLSRYLSQGGGTYVYTTRTGSRYSVRSVPVAPTITAANLYGLYKGTDSDGREMTLFYMGSGIPQGVEKSTCPTL